MQKIRNVLVIIGAVSLVLGIFLISRYSLAGSNKIIAILLFVGGLVLLSIINTTEIVSGWLYIIEREKKLDHLEESRIRE
jgi:uncharacterized membrane protein